MRLRMTPDTTTSQPTDPAPPESTQVLRVRVLTALVFVLSLLAGFVVMNLSQRSRALEGRVLATTVASGHTHAIQERLARSLSATYALAAVLAQGDGEIKDFEALGVQMLSVYGGITALQLAKNGIITASVPRVGNEKALGHNLLDDTARNKEARLAVSTRKLTLAGPFELVQGGMAVIGRLPVFLPDAQQQPVFWGFTTALIRIPDLMESAHLKTLTQQGYRYRLWRIHPDSLQKQVISGTDTQPFTSPVDATFDVPNGQWTLSVEPIAGWSSLQPAKSELAAVLLVSIMLGLLAHTLLMQPLRLRRDVALRTQELAQANLKLGEEIREREKSEAKMQLAASVFTHAREGIMITDAGGVIVDVNDTFTSITGFSREEALGQNPRILNSGRQPPEYYEAMWHTLTHVGHWTGEVWNRRKNGEVYAELLTMSAVRDARGKTKNYVALFTDITQIKEHQQRLEHIAHFDALTNLPNRVLLADRLQQAMAQSQRRECALAVAYLDLDGFKSVNDSHGHSVGDELLIVLAQRMKSALRDGDTLARIGGDEFVAVLGDLNRMQDCEPVLGRLLLAAASAVTVGGVELQVSASMGVTVYPQDGVDADLLMRHADQAMYLAKQAGKNCYHLFDIAQDAAVQTQRESLEHIRAALDAREFVLYYQPKVNMKTGLVIGAEALIRWQHPERGLLSPAEFLPIIEDNAISVELGEWVIDSALTQMSQWHRAGTLVNVSVNVGARQLQQEHFVARLQKLLASHADIHPHCLELEILETSALEDMAKVSDVMHACRLLGVTFALDDFGTGYSSLTYLKRLPAELLKIDQSFVRDMIDDPEDMAIVKGVVGLASAFHRSVIAEGVETHAHGELLLSLGCEMAQGYGIARPMAATALPDWVNRWHHKAIWTA